MQHERLSGLIAATYTPLKTNGDLNLDQIPPLVDHLLGSGVTGMYVCGSTGEGMSLSTGERKQVTGAFMQAVNRRVPVIVQVGHNSLADARDLAQHAAEVGADAVSATCPSYFKVSDVPTLVDCMADLASAAPDTPFYYYHIPSLTGSSLDIVDFMRRGGDRIGNMVGLKYTDTKLHEFLECLTIDDGRFDIVWGCDEMLLGALATGANAAIGSTYNIAAPLYRQIIDAFTRGDMNAARQHQLRSVQMIRTIYQFPFHPAMKEVLGMLGIECGPCRLPQKRLSPGDTNRLMEDLQAIDFFSINGVVL
ncbi:dihydrodipicolinate synthase family protein [Stieleria varia]|uniref:N-acetylneuraminate lyase n=1 Tax=Stieleria varia TaxID=2528005 RepID=A0A5C6A4K4_9BACT|nr:dihydrodipicolinate synthase family protein [Stieleria varia]TWT93313.1 N-acetylneuraminate lyase [Stieleria varia]